MKRKYLILFSLSGFILCCDQLTKQLVSRYFNPGESVSLLSDFLIVKLETNAGFAFGLLSGLPASLQEIFFIGIPIFALLLIVLIFIKLQDDQMLTSSALTCILAGAIGNLIDRIQFGHVVDFIEIRLGSWLSFPSFNIADFSIIIGVAMVFISTLHPSGAQSNHA